MEQKTEQFAVDTRNRTIKQWGQGLLTLLIGLTIAHLGVTLFLLSSLGSDAFTIFVEGLSGLIGISIGTCHACICVVLMVVMALFTRGYVKPGTILCAFLGGWIIDLFMLLLGGVIHAESHIALRIGAMVLGCGILSFGMSLVIKSNSGTGPNDLVAIILSDKINKRWKVAFRWVRIAVDLLFILLGFFLGGTLGVGTIAAAVLIGPIVQLCLPVSQKLIHKVFPEV